MATEPRLCVACRGVAHPSTGCAWSERTLICAGCARSFWRWVMDHTRARKKGPDFYGAALNK